MLLRHIVNPHNLTRSESCRSRGWICRWLLLRDTGLTEDGAKLVCHATLGMRALETLDLSGNEITVDAVEDLSRCLEAHTSLKQLLLDDNELESEGAKALAVVLQREALVPALEGEQRLFLYRCLGTATTAAAAAADAAPPLPPFFSFSDDGPIW